MNDYGPKIASSLFLVTISLVILAACDSNKSSTNQPAPFESLTPSKMKIAYIFGKDLRMASHQDIFKKQTKETIIKAIHRHIMCRVPDNIKTEKLVAGQYYVKCRETVWGEKIENLVFADIRNSSQYDVKNGKMEAGRSFESMLNVADRVVIFGADLGGRESGVLGVAAGIPNLKSDPFEYSSEPLSLEDPFIGRKLITKRIVAVAYDFANFFSENDSAKNEVIKTSQHELGHSFGLFHTFQRDSQWRGDLVDDTPLDPHGLCILPEIERNIMSYCADGELGEFTPGQINRMNQVIKEFDHKAI